LIPPWEQTGKCKKKACLQHTGFVQYFGEEKCVCVGFLHVTLILLLLSISVNKTFFCVSTVVRFLNFFMYVCSEWVLPILDANVITHRYIVVNGKISSSFFFFLVLVSLYWRDTRSLPRNWRKCATVSPWLRIDWLVISSRLRALRMSQTCNSTSRSIRFDIVSFA